MKPTVKETINRTVLVDNSADKDRSYDIAARVNIESGKVNNISDGTLRAKGQPVDVNAPIMPEVNFYSNSADYMSLNFNAGTERVEKLAAIEDFIADIKEHATEL